MNQDPTFFPGRSARIMFKPMKVDSKSTSTTSSALENLKADLYNALPGVDEQKPIEIGQLGILHPEVLKHFELDYPCSTLEFDLSYFL